MLLGKTHYNLAMGCQSGIEVLSFLLHILLNPPEEILPKLIKKSMIFSLELRKGWVFFALFHLQNNCFFSGLPVHLFIHSSYDP